MESHTSAMYAIKMKNRISSSIVFNDIHTLFSGCIIRCTKVENKLKQSVLLAVFDGQYQVLYKIINGKHHHMFC
jgi:hypothetical protein